MRSVEDFWAWLQTQVGYDAIATEALRADRLAVAERVRAACAVEADRCNEVGAVTTGRILLRLDLTPLIEGDEDGNAQN